jgi:hypothetical protein
MQCLTFVRSNRLSVWLVADGWCLFVLREKYCWLIARGWFVLREKYCCLMADKPNEQAEKEKYRREEILLLSRGR